METEMVGNCGIWRLYCRLSPTVFFPDVALTPPVMSQMCSNELILNWMVFNTTTFIKGDVVVIFYNIELDSV